MQFPHHNNRPSRVSASLFERLAKLLLSWPAETMQGDGSTQVKLTLTQEEIAETIGTTREVVSHLISEFRQK
jgi:CRP-like cAMP-binding protein